ncbi:DUF1254 domain-containing protein [Aquamicrobium sp. LC103]|uniref:DUF1254 domain-containing protein n=1 Tax=Aquamicrobium sp. LC103 TaxID=1120658 RepID=UPI00063E9C41|nr:DUF1254 domain-containing protein [Aquamicrobium sp. LC103]TKT81218.1 DUF1254 domain-containing protein [Aquamicrobium sp. LC103]
MGRLLQAIILGLIGAAAVHIAVLLMLPGYSERDAWSRLKEMTDMYETVRIDSRSGGEAAIKSLDPLFDAVACRFDLRDGVTRVSAAAHPEFWSISIYDRMGQNVFSFNDRAAPDGVVDFVVATPTQMIELRNELPAEFDKSVFVETDINEGIAVVRSFVPDETWEPTVSRYLREIDCVPH